MGIVRRATGILRKPHHRKKKKAPRSDQSPASFRQLQGPTAGAQLVSPAQAPNGQGAAQASLPSAAAEEAHLPPPPGALPKRKSNRPRLRAAEAAIASEALGLSPSPQQSLLHPAEGALRRRVQPDIEL
eukprot:Hpha_TRINITY_DN15090_c2_g1::TRINITY_DN15090_c2_g1_i1::g.123358::m.123358